jgi:maleylacetate reductase
VIVRWGLEQLPEVLADVGSNRPFAITSDRWSNLDLPAIGRWSEVPSDRIPEIAAKTAGADGILAVGGGSAIDLAKAVSAATGLPVVSVPTTYSGAEWTPFYGVRDPQKHMVGGGGGAHLAGIVYDPKLTLDLPRAESGGTAMNALAHCAEALYVTGRNPTGDQNALEGASLIGATLPAVLANGQDVEARTTLLEGAMHAGMALGAAGLGLGHAMAQAVGGRYGLPHGAANALCLPPALRFNEPVAGGEIERFGEALGADDPIARTEELARLAGYERLRDLGVPEDELDEVAEATAVRGGALANPRPASPAQIAELFRSIY